MAWRAMKAMAALVATATFALAGVASGARSDSKPAPDRGDVSYGPHERNVFDFWKPTGAAPGADPAAAPLFIFFHGGGFVGGDKWTLDGRLLEACRQRGIAVATANYRFSTHKPFPAPMLDGARVAQYLRSRAVEFGIDPGRIIVGGDSAGAGISLWLGFHDDLTDLKNDDPVLRESSRVSGMVVWGAQCSYDPRFIREKIGGRAYEHPALPKLFGVEPAQLDSPEAAALYEQASMINMVTRDDPPALLFYAEPKAPLPPGPNTGPTLYFENFGMKIPGAHRPGQGIHHPRFGVELKAKMDEAGAPCEVVHRDDVAATNPGKDPGAEIVARAVDFMMSVFKIQGE